MMAMTKYFRYVLRHKWFVFIECCKLGVPWLGIIHDWSKFLPSEFIPYARHFYGKGRGVDSGHGSTGYYKPVNTGDPAFDWAWFLHQKRNKHHWQWWCKTPVAVPSVNDIPSTAIGAGAFDMPIRYRKEMLADWRGAGRALGTPDTAAWYRAHEKDMVLGMRTRIWMFQKLVLGDK
jgi:hypothetical protein